MSTSISPLEALPLLILDSICEFLAHFHSDRRSLFAFSLASKSCCSVATKQRFERIRFTVRGWEKLHNDIERWNKILRPGRRAYVRRVRIEGYIPRCELDQPGPEENNASFYANQKLNRQNVDKDESDLDEHWDLFCQPPKSIGKLFHQVPPILSEKSQHLENEIWRPLVCFLNRLPALRDLVYSSSDQLPACIISSLRQHHPNTRLHVHGFSLPGCFRSIGLSECKEPDEFGLATLPRLYSVELLYCDFNDLKKQVSYHEQVVAQVAAAAASQLRSVNMWHYLPLQRPRQGQGDTGTPRAPENLSLTGKQEESPGLTRSKGRLQSLVLGGHSAINRDHISTWDAHIDLSQLRTLEIRIQVHLDVVRSLTRLAEDRRLESLHSLTLFAAIFKWEEVAEVDGAMGQLLQNLSPLEVLRLQGFIGEKTFETVLNRHGKTLRKLHFVPGRQSIEARQPYTISEQQEPYIISEHFIRDLQRNCPNLRELTLLITRTRGDEQEVRIYRAIGRLPWLKRLSLKLDCTHLSRHLSTSNLSQESDTSRTLMRELLQSYAVDSVLGLEIFGLVSTAGTLQRLNLDFLKDMNQFPDWLARMVDLVAKSWVIRRNSAGNVVHRDVRRNSAGNVVHIDVRRTGFWTHACTRSVIPKFQQQLGMEAWPEMRTGDWQNEWYSLPLAGQPPRSSGRGPVQSFTDTSVYRLDGEFTGTNLFS